MSSEFEKPVWILRYAVISILIAYFTQRERVDLGKS